MIDRRNRLAVGGPRGGDEPTGGLAKEAADLDDGALGGAALGEVVKGIALLPNIACYLSWRYPAGSLRSPAGLGGYS